MKKEYLFISVGICLVFVLGNYTLAEEGTFEYPYHLIDAYDADDSCWTGMDVNGVYHGPVQVVPEQWLVGPPPSDKSGVTLPPDHWVELLFRGQIIDGPGYDIKLIELGPVSEQALIFLTNGAGQEKLIGIATSGRRERDSAYEDRAEPDIRQTYGPVRGKDRGRYRTGFFHER